MLECFYFYHLLCVLLTKLRLQTVSAAVFDSN